MKGYLFRYYQKKIKTILANFETIGSRPEAEAIHTLRVNIKNTRAIFHFLEVVAPNKFKARQHDVLKNIFKCAGSLREIQVNLKNLDRYSLHDSDKKLYLQYAKASEEKLRIEFSKAIKDFAFHRLSKTSKTVKKLLKKTSRKKIISKAQKFLLNESKKIEKHKTAPKTLENTHKIRKHLKSLHTIATLLTDVEPTENLNKVIFLIKKAEVLIGNWHDKVVLINSLEKFLEEKKKSGKRKFSSVKKLISVLNNENEEQIKKIYSKLNTLLLFFR